MNDDTISAIKMMKSGQYKLAKELLFSSASNGDTVAQERLGFIHMYGIGVDIDYNEAKHWLVLSAATGNGKAHFYLGKIYYEEKEFVLAFKSFSESAAKKFPPSFYCYQ